VPSCLLVGNNYRAEDRFNRIIPPHTMVGFALNFGAIHPTDCMQIALDGHKCIAAQISTFLCQLCPTGLAKSKNDSFEWVPSLAPSSCSPNRYFNYVKPLTELMWTIGNCIINYDSASNSHGNDANRTVAMRVKTWTEKRLRHIGH